MTAKLEPPGGAARAEEIDLDTYDRQLMTAVVNRAEKLGKRVMPLIVPTNNPLNAVLITAKDIGAQEVMLGASNKYSAEEQLDQIALYWISLNAGQPLGLTVHIVSADRDVSFDLEGGNRIPKAAERQARSVAELRAAGIGVRRVLMGHDQTQTSRDVFQWLLTMLSPDVVLDIVPIQSFGPEPPPAEDYLELDRKHAEQLGREVKKLLPASANEEAFVLVARTGNYDVAVLPWSAEVLSHLDEEAGQWVSYVVRHASCNVFLASHAAIPKEVAVGA
jgi:nucleotide-binding universal stress UspA family protein